MSCCREKVHQTGGNNTPRTVSGFQELQIACERIWAAGDVDHTAQAGLVDLFAKVRSQPCPGWINEEKNAFRLLFFDMRKHCRGIAAKEMFFRSSLSFQVFCRCFYCLTVKFDSENFLYFGLSCKEGKRSGTAVQFSKNFRFCFIEQ